MKKIILVLALFLWLVNFLNALMADPLTVFQQIVQAISFTNGILIGIFVLLVGILFKK